MKVGIFRDKRKQFDEKKFFDGLMYWRCEDIADPSNNHIYIDLEAESTLEACRTVLETCEQLDYIICPAVSYNYVIKMVKQYCVDNKPDNLIMYMESKWNKYYIVRGWKIRDGELL